VEHACVCPIAGDKEVVVVEHDARSARKGWHSGGILAEGLVKGGSIDDHNGFIPFEVLLQGAIRTEEVESGNLVYVKGGMGAEDASQSVDGQADEENLSPIIESEAERLGGAVNRSAERRGVRIGVSRERLVLAAAKQACDGERTHRCEESVGHGYPHGRVGKLGRSAVVGPSWPANGVVAEEARARACGLGSAGWGIIEVRRYGRVPCICRQAKLTAGMRLVR